MLPRRAASTVAGGAAKIKGKMSGIRYGKAAGKASAIRFGGKKES